MESELDVSKEKAAKLDEEEKQAREHKAAIEYHLEKMNAVEPLKDTAKSKAKAFHLVKGMHKWKPLFLSTDSLSFEVVGPTPSSCIQVEFKVAPSGEVSGKAFCEESIFGKHKKGRSGRKFRAVEAYIAHRVQTLVNRVGTLTSVKEIGGLLRGMEQAIGRLEHTCSELVLLHRRYNAMLVVDLAEDSQGVQVEVDFGGSGDDAKVFAAFLLTDSYPFAPLDVRLDVNEEGIDVEDLRRRLMKGAKPGFGYLSRTCDVISAFVG